MLRVLIELLDNAEDGHSVVREIAESHPAFAGEARYRDYRAKHGIE